MVIAYSTYDVKVRLGMRLEAKALLDRAKIIFQDVRREYWWTGLGTFWLDILKRSIPEIDVYIK